MKSLAKGHAEDNGRARNELRSFLTAEALFSPPYYASPRETSYVSFMLVSY